jgi:hypothetical protein
MSGTGTLKYEGIKPLCEMTIPPPSDSNVQHTINKMKLIKYV